MISVSEAVPDGNIVDLGSEGATTFLGIRPDPGLATRQWFHLRCDGPAGDLVVVDAHRTTYPAGWHRMRLVASPNGRDWRRLATSYRDGRLVFRHLGGRCSYALAAPHDEARLQQALDALQASGRAAVTKLAKTLQGRPLPLVELGSGSRSIAVIARQHGGEPPAGWCCEGLMRRLVTDDEAATALRRQARVMIAPLTNPDGARLGQLRTTAAGIDPNREWHSPQPCREVAAVRSAMEARGVDLLIDMHADFVLRYPYIDPADGLPEQRDRLTRLRSRFEAALLRHTEDFQTVRRYPYAEPVCFEDRLGQRAPWTAARFDCLAVTLELPVADFDARPDLVVGWSPERSMAVGAALVPAMLSVLSSLG